jgi:hypothetical protein
MNTHRFILMHILLIVSIQFYALTSKLIIDEVPNQKDNLIAKIEEDTIISNESMLDVAKVFSPPPGVVIFNSKSNSGKFVGSPGLTVLADGTYIATHDLFGNFISDTYVYKSVDKGKTWEYIAKIDSLTWAKPFNIGDSLYLLGVFKGKNNLGNIAILKSVNGGYNWSRPTDNKHGLLLVGDFHTAPTSILFYKNKIFKAFERTIGYQVFSCFIMSVNVNTDLLDLKNWNFSNEINYSKTFSKASTWEEGNAVLDKDSNVDVVMRLSNYNPDDRVAILKMTDDMNLTFDSVSGISSFPGGSKKFTILYDSLSKKYWTLSNYVLYTDRTNYNGYVRNTVVLAWSDDLYKWNIEDTLLHCADYYTHGFQYIDWQIEDDDIIAVSRTAWEDDTGQAHSQHDANYLTFHRFTNFRDKIEKKIEDTQNKNVLIRSVGDNLIITSKEALTGQLLIYDVAGICFYNKIINTDDKEIIVDVSFLNKGVYVFKSKYLSGNKINLKFIKSN